MKLIAHDNRQEGQCFREDAFIVFGRTPPKGWYVLCNARFVKRIHDDYLDRFTFTVRSAVCYPVLVLTWRIPRGHRPKYRMYFDVHWTEILNKEEE